MKATETNSPILHLQQQQLLLRMEYEYEKEEFKRQTETMGWRAKWNEASVGIPSAQDETITTRLIS